MSFRANASTRMCWLPPIRGRLLEMSYLVNSPISNGFEYSSSA